MRLRVAIGLMMAVAQAAFAQTLSLPTNGVFIPGRYMPLRIDADQAGEIHIRGDGIQGIDLPAAGRGNVVVPLMIWRTSAGPLNVIVNGKSQRLDIEPLAEGEPIPSLLAAYDPAYAVGPKSAAIDESAYENLDLWTPGRSETVRTYITRAAIVAMLLLAAALHLKRRPSAWLVAITAGGLTAAIVWAMPADIARVELPVSAWPARLGLDDAKKPVNGRVWIWRHTHHAQTIEEPFGRSLWFIPRSVEQLQRTKPVLECDSRGNPLMIRLTLGENDRAAFVRELKSSASAE